MKSLYQLRDARRETLKIRRIVSRMETEGRELTDEEVVNECKYILETIDYAGYGSERTREIKAACRYIISRSRF